jgi:hypothetical protein
MSGSGKRGPITYKGRSIGILTLTVAQLLIGVIHFAVGLGLLAAKIATTQGVLAYDIYTVSFGVLVLYFAVLIWRGDRAGWFGTVAVSLFVISADTLTVLKLPSVPGIPVFAAPTEIVYSLAVLAYLFRKNIRKKFIAS